jgi:type II secretory pathway pseudopilin PulG
MIKKRITGFTLVETLVAVVLGVISVTAVFYSYQYFNNSYRSVMDKASISNSARDALSLISRDLRNAGYKDVNYTKDSWTRIIEAKDKYPDNSPGDMLGIYYNISPNDRVRIWYYMKQYKNDNSFYLTRALVENPVTVGKIIYEDEIIVPYVTDFQVVLKDQNGNELKPVCYYCGPEELKYGSRDQGRDNQFKVHTAEIYLTIRSPNEIYKKERRIEILNHNSTTGRKMVFNDRYHHETFFTSVHTRNISKVR